MSNESDDSDQEESEKLGSESGSARTYGTRLGGFLRGLGFPLGVMVSTDESRNGDGGLLKFPTKILVKRVPDNLP